MKEIHLIFSFLVLNLVTTMESREFKDETLKKILITLKSFEDKNQDNQSGSSPDLSVDEDKSVDENEDVFEISLPKCGQPNIEPNINQKIVNGKPARPNSWPWQVSLQIKNSEGMYRHICGGSIISNDIVLTAAHCLSGMEYSYVVVVAGSNDQTRLDEQVQMKKVTRIINHPLYFANYTRPNNHVSFMMNDIAVLILETPLTYQYSVSPICLPNKDPDMSSFCYATGWGDPKGTGNKNILNQIRLRISEEECSIYSKFPDRELCTISEFHHGGTSKGDSGGPLMCRERNVWYLHGICSTGLEVWRPTKYIYTMYSIFTKVYSFLDWINETTGDILGDEADSELCQVNSKVALVTGSTSGIGLEAAHSLASNGANIVLSGFGDDALITSIKSDIKGKHQVECQHIPVDLKVQSEVDKFINNVMKSNMKGIDILINNAGFQYVSKVNEFPVEKWNDIIAVLLTSPFLLIRSFLPSMMERGWGRIINIGSVHSLKASPNKAAYCSAKHGLVGLTKVVALETAGTGVTCNLISPGFVDTPILQSQVLNLADKENISYEKAKKLFLSHYHPSGEAITVEQVTALCVYLCSQAADQITGSNLVVDGGWTSK